MHDEAEEVEREDHERKGYADGDHDQADGERDVRMVRVDGMQWFEQCATCCRGDDERDHGKKPKRCHFLDVVLVSRKPDVLIVSLCVRWKQKVRLHDVHKPEDAASRYCTIKPPAGPQEVEEGCSAEAKVGVEDARGDADKGCCAHREAAEK